MFSPLLFLALVVIVAAVWAAHNRRSAAAKLDAQLRAEALEEGRQEKTCPDCQSEVPIEANVCRYCRYRFN